MKACYLSGLDGSFDSSLDIKDFKHLEEIINGNFDDNFNFNL